MKRGLVILVPTKKAEDSIVISAGKAWFFPGIFEQDYLESQEKKSYHLYVVSEEQVKNGDAALLDWSGNLQEGDLRVGQVLDVNYDDISSIKMTNQFGTNQSHCNTKDYKNSKWYKIIGTTDRNVSAYNHGEGQHATTLLSNLTKEFVSDFIAKFNEDNTIKEIDFELNEKNCIVIL